MKRLTDIIKSGKGILPLILLFAAGIFLVFLSDNDKAVESTDYSVNEDFDFESYESTLELKIAEHINKISGVSNCEVVIILDSSYLYEYVRLDSGDVLICESDGREIPVIEVLRSPEIKGVSVICSGGNDPQIKKQISDMLTALLNVSSNNIWVGGKE